MFWVAPKNRPDGSDSRGDAHEAQPCRPSSDRHPRSRRIDA
ncbi:Hypothetical protein MIP_03846 [Mycobacterium intracellulare subsp. intracellulare MTCC 9506]|uniref:Uncharacterized protein n=1 Tax=Mycobacterium indicus pranii (strain DSM 45239 / MTCC 9506) TaxID=1232724 RepID=J9WH62_MYCIP|nr:Hypothetical protein MIP_03846 [Mycobacterium intracellulare subsp. intracellulare MTCC 9506]